MRRLIQALYFIVLVVMVSACQNLKGDFLPEIDVELSVELSNNEMVIDFVSGNQSMLNEYSNSLEELVIKCNPLVIKDETELLPSEKELLGTLMMEFTEKLGMFAVRVAEMETSYTTVEYALDEADLPKFNAIMVIFSDRVLLINSRYSNFGIPDENPV